MRISDWSSDVCSSDLIEPLEDGSLPWYGQPFFGISATLFEIDRLDPSDDFPDDDANNATRSVTFSTGANYTTWSWNLSHTVYSFDDHVHVSSDTLNNTTGPRSEEPRAGKECVSTS